MVLRICSENLKTMKNTLLRMSRITHCLWILRMNKKEEKKGRKLRRPWQSVLMSLLMLKMLRMTPVTVKLVTTSLSLLIMMMFREYSAAGNTELSSISPETVSGIKWYSVNFNFIFFNNSLGLDIYATNDLKTTIA